LRRWFSHDPTKWEEFRSRYETDLKRQNVSLRRIKQVEKENGTVTLLYSARDDKHNQTIVLAAILRS
jgi:uncharacterized protein YeaO (DUF488 family)